VPPLSPETMPALLTVPTTGVLLVHVPPGVASDNVIVAPAHMLPAPVMAAVKAVTVTTIVAGVQPETVYDIVVVPALMPVTVPVEPTVATDVVPLVHVPPGVTSDKVVPVPAHKLPAPVMGAVAVTVSKRVRVQPETVYEIVAVPAPIPVTTPEEPIVATTVALLTHVPPGTASDSVIVEPAHKLPAPVMGAVGLTETMCVAAGQPETVYEMVVVPPLSPETIPAVLTVPTTGVLLAHVPPGVASDSVIVAPAHTLPAPVMGAVTVVTVTTMVAGVQPETVYDIVLVPVLMPVTIPVEPTVTTEMVPLVHVPPGVASDNVVLVPTHKLPAPVMEAVAVTVSTRVTVQPDTV
jgi:hypothetical protein